MLGILVQGISVRVGKTEEQKQLMTVVWLSTRKRARLQPAKPTAPSQLWHTGPGIRNSLNTCAARDPSDHTKAPQHWAGVRLGQ